MNFAVEELPIPGAKLLRAPVRGDARGAFIKTFHVDDLEALGFTTPIAEQYYSVSQRGVIRGMHFQLPPSDHEKFVHCSRGRALDVLVDLRTDSPAYGTVAHVDLAGMDGLIVHMPRGIAHGFQALEDDTVLHYSVTSVYDPANDAGVRWDSIDAPWATDVEPVVSDRDRDFPTLAEFVSPFRLARS